MVEAFSNPGSIAARRDRKRSIAPVAEFRHSACRSRVSPYLAILSRSVVRGMPSI